MNPPPPQSARDIEATRNAAATQLNSFLKELGYE